MPNIGGPVGRKPVERTPDTVQVWLVRDSRKEGKVVARLHSKYAAKEFILLQKSEDRAFLTKERLMKEGA